MITIRGETKALFHTKVFTAGGSDLLIKRTQMIKPKHSVSMLNTHFSQHWKSLDHDNNSSIKHEKLALTPGPTFVGHTGTYAQAHSLSD